MKQESKRKQFLRIVTARLKYRYTYEPQRRAIAAKMYVKWLQRKGALRHHL